MVNPNQKLGSETLLYEFTVLQFMMNESCYHIEIVESFYILAGI